MITDRTGGQFNDAFITGGVVTINVVGISGDKTVGVGGDYPTLTAAIADLNSKVITGPVTFLLIDSSYGTTNGPLAAEVFPIVINRNGGSNMMNTVTIKPGPPMRPGAPDNVVSITGSSPSALIIFNGAIWTILDGSESNGTDRSLTMTNTDTGTSSQ